MVDGRVEASKAAEFLDGLLARLESLLARVDELEASGEMTPELEADIESRLAPVWVLLPAVRESVDPSMVPLLRMSRLARAKAAAMKANGVDVDEIRSTFAGLVERTEGLLSGEEREHFGPRVMATLDDVLAGDEA